jgi:ABC-type antimicrobial peptide transport system permease subunit
VAADADRREQWASRLVLLLIVTLVGSIVGAIIGAVLVLLAMEAIF